MIVISKRKSANLCDRHFNLIIMSLPTYLPFVTPLLSTLRKKSFNLSLSLCLGVQKRNCRSTTYCFCANNRVLFPTVLSLIKFVVVVVCVEEKETSGGPIHYKECRGLVVVVTFGIGCGSVGRAVASDTRGPRFESSHRQTLYYLLVYCQL